MRIIVDTDDVIRDFVPTLVKVYKECYPEHVVPPIISWDLTKFFPIGEDIREFYSEINPDIFYIAPPINGAIGFLKQLRRDGHHIILSTSQHRLETQIITMEWYNKHEILYNDIVFTKNKSTINADIIIDDNPKQLNQALYTPMTVLPFTQAWNIEWQTRFLSNTHKEEKIKHLESLSDIDKFEEIYRVIKSLTLKKDRIKFSKIFEQEEV
uniref:FCP1 homology domain-containing protein n=1 Tax=viral metagenome TaxID=1070528 RepID=A0A6H1ZBA2_9ZZZZ